MVFGKQKIATLVAEFLGTGALTLLILSVQRSTIGVPFFVAAAAGLSIALMIMAVGKTSGGYFNPALTIGFWTARKIETVTAVLYILVQFAGAFAAGALYA
ncbi:MAG TPA: aquaporin, partial [Methylomirabilota bacterium]|nr:aquaporin [Methylomirabilota bacterium]